jgi:RNA polymerase sigma-70 factor (ECF subfamily)
MSDLDRRLGELCEQGDYDQATTIALKELGPSVLRFIAARTRDDDLTSEAFARFAEDVWRGLRGFSGRSSVRVWAFVIARNAAGQVLRRRNRDRKRTRPFTTTLVEELTEQVRTVTQEYLKTATKERFAELRERLSEEEQTLLVLRINERLGWDEIARIHLDAAADAAVKREAARLRKKFQVLRDKLQKMAVEEGLFENEKARLS